MTTELEQEFFKVFGIEPRCHNPIVYYLSADKKCKGLCQNCEKYKYPNITAEKLLEMICILNFKFPTLHNACGSDRKTLLEYVLTRCITDKNYIGQQVQALFKGEE